MGHSSKCELPFWKNASVLFKNFTLHYKPQCEHSAGNFIARIFIVAFFVGLVGSVLGGLSLFLFILLFSTLTAFMIVMITSPPVEYTSVEHKPEQHNAHYAHGVEVDSMDYHELPHIATVAPKVKDHFVNGGKAIETFVNGGKAIETFVNGGNAIGSVQPVHEPTGMSEVDAFPYSGPALPDYTPPTSRNPFMNILVDEMKYNPNRPHAAPVDNSIVKQTMDDYFRVQWFSDPTDVFGKNQGQRQFVTQPSTTVPNDQGSFANWLYKIPGKTCKEGGREACLGGTDGATIPWLNHSS